MANWARLAAVADCPPGTTLESVAGDRVVALYNVDGDFYALDGVCPHQGGPLGRGELEGPIVTCPWHGWQFNVCDGQHQFNATLKQPRLDVKVDGDAVFVDVES